MLILNISIWLMQCLWEPRPNKYPYSGFICSKRACTVSLNAHHHDSETLHCPSLNTYCALVELRERSQLIFWLINFLLVPYFLLNGQEGVPSLFTIIHLVIGLLPEHRQPQIRERLLDTILIWSSIDWPLIPHSVVLVIDVFYIQLLINMIEMYL